MEMSSLAKKNKNSAKQDADGRGEMDTMDGNLVNGNFRWWSKKKGPETLLGMERSKGQHP